MFGLLYEHIRMLVVVVWYFFWAGAYTEDMGRLRVFGGSVASRTYVVAYVCQIIRQLSPIAY
jgi:hypothetical protein